MSTFEKMNPEIKAKWVAALRSGEREQTKGELHDYNGFCCLGVLADINGHLVKSERNDWEMQTGVHRFSSPEFAHYDAHAMVPLDYCGLEDPAIDKLWQMNDCENKTFVEIADWIEANL